ncbi:hypothetical protein AGR5A_pa40106 [Agrobacterium genomosp. 5 str. CFBP 6626]|nr:hypothetical protein AGR5A_pa40106 [Agrobacterium genomosp. 5 str. CFBP 6626]
MGDHQFLVRQGAYHCLDLKAELLDGAQAAMAEGDLIMSRLIRMRAHEDRYLLPLRTDRGQQTVDIARHAVSNERRLHESRVKVDYDLTFGEAPLDFVGARLTSFLFAHRVGHLTDKLVVGCGGFYGHVCIDLDQIQEVFSAHVARPQAFLIRVSISSLTLFIASIARS